MGRRVLPWYHRLWANAIWAPPGGLLCTCIRKLAGQGMSSLVALIVD
jgi:hypothetical protein